MSLSTNKTAVDRARNQKGVMPGGRPGAQRQAGRTVSATMCCWTALAFVRCAAEPPRDRPLDFIVHSGAEIIDVSLSSLMSSHHRENVHAIGMC